MPKSSVINQPQAQPQTVFRRAPRRSFLSRNWIWLFLLLLCAAGGTGYYYYNYLTISSAEVAYVKRGTAVTSVYGTVNVDPVDQVIVRTRNYGQLSALKIKEGDAVKKDQELAEVTDDTFQRQLDTVQSNIAQAKVRQSLGPPSLAAMKNKEIEVDKLKNLVAAGNIAQVELDKAQNELTQLKQQVQNETISLANDVDSQQRVMDSLQAQFKENKIVSSMDGVVLNVYANLGEYLPPQTQICRIGSAANKIVANVNEEDIGYLQPGMKAQIRLYAFQDKNLPGTLVSVGSDSVNQAYKVIFTLDDPTQNLLPGMTGEMNVIVGERQNALTIPTRAIRHGGNVLTVVNGVVQSAKVRVGFHTLETSEILEGLDEGTAVILSNQDLYKPGMHVRELNAKDN
jgi:RND family efflux transporter MFP subunit